MKGCTLSLLLLGSMVLWSRPVLFRDVERVIGLMVLRTPPA